MTLSQQQIRGIAEEALDAACLHIQKELDVLTGDKSAMCLSAYDGKLVSRILSDYIRFEILYKENAE